MKLFDSILLYFTSDKHEWEQHEVSEQRKVWDRAELHCGLSPSFL